MKSAPARKPVKGQPPWTIAQLYPNQGSWDEEDYLGLSTNRLVEFADGVIEVLPMPTTDHQETLGYLYRRLDDFVRAGKLGKVLVAALPVKLWKGKYREPDVVFMASEHTSRIRRRYWQGADLVMEVVSDDPESRKRDLVKKRREYARARIPEYWIVDPKKSTITVLKLKGPKYAVAGEYKPGERAKSILLAGFEVDVRSALKPE